VSHNITILKKIVVLTLAATAFRCSEILGTPMDRHIGKYLVGIPFAGAAVLSSSIEGDSNSKNAKVEELPSPFIWLDEAELELKKIPFFVRGKAKRNIESYATDKGVEQICVATMAEARTHFSKR
jgi:hypothetical protein